MMYVVVIDGEVFVTEASNRRVAWKTALAKAALMSKNGELEDDDVVIQVLSEKEAKKHGVSILFAGRLDRRSVFEEFERARLEGVSA